MANIDPRAAQEITVSAYSPGYEDEQKHGCGPQRVLAAVQGVPGIVDDANVRAHACD